MNPPTTKRERFTRATARALFNRRVATILGVLVVVSVASVFYFSWVFSAANKVQDSVSSMEAIDLASVARGDAAAALTAEVTLDETEDRISSLSSRIRPVRVMATGIGWVPFLGDQFKGPVALVQQAESALETTRSLIPAAASLSEFESVVVSPSFLSGEPDAEIDSLIASVQRDAELSSSSLADLQAAGDELRNLRLLPVLRAKADQAEKIEIRLSAAVDMVSIAPDLIRSAQAMSSTAAEIAKTQNIDDDGLNFEQLGALASQLRDDAASANDYASDFSAAAEQAIPGSDISKLSAELVTATESVHQLASGLSGLIHVAQPAMDALRDSEGPLLRDGSAIRASLETLLANEDQIDIAVTDIESGVVSLTNLVESNSSVVSSSAISDLLDQADLLVSVGSLLRDGPALAMDLIAIDSEKTYLVIGQTSDELRAAGGFTSSVWTIRFNNGALASSSYIPVLEFDDETARNLAPSVPSALNVHMDAGSLYLRDVGWDPHFPAVGELSAELYRLNQKDEVDGVIAITQWGLIDLIDAIGGIETAQGFIAPEEALAVIELETDAQGTGFLQFLFDGLIESIRGDNSDKELLVLLKAIRDTFSEKDLMIYSQEPDVQSELVSLDWAGVFPLGQADRLAVVDSNIGWTKSDRSIDRTASYEVDLRDIERPQAQLDLTYRHTGVPVGRDCSEQRVPVGPEHAYELARNSCYWDYFRVYAALGSEVFIQPTLPLPVNSVADRIGRIDAGSSTFSHGFDSNGDFFSGVFAIEAGQGELVSIKYDLPTSVTETIEGGYIYRLNLFAQPGAGGRHTTVRVLLPEGHQVSGASHEATRLSTGSAVFEFDLLTDETLVVEIVESAALPEVFEAGY